MDETTKFLELPDVGAAYGWQRHPGPGPAAYLDGDAFNRLHVLAVVDGMSGTVKATVLYAGTPVLVVRWTGSDYDHESPVLADPDHASAYTHFLVDVGEAGEGADEWQADFPGRSVWESPHVGEGHQLVAFVGVVARALHRAFPDECGEPTGF